MKRTKKILKFLNDKGEVIADEDDNETEIVEKETPSKKLKLNINIEEAYNPLFEHTELLCYGCLVGWGNEDNTDEIWTKVDEMISTNIFGTGIKATIQAIAKTISDERAEFPGGDWEDIKFGEEEIERHLEHHCVNQKFYLRRQLDDNAEMLQRLKNMENLGPVNMNFFIKLTENERKILDAIEICKHNKEYSAITTKKT